LMIRSGFEYTSNTYDLKLNSRDGKTQFKEPYHWYILTKVVDRTDYQPATGEYMKHLTKEMEEFAKKNLPK
jgi:hypothetical protein